MTGFYTGAMTLSEVRAARPSTIYYGARTCWWTHDPTHLGRTSGSTIRADGTIVDDRTGKVMGSMPIASGRERKVGGLPCGPRGEVLYQTDDVEGFLSSAEQNPQHYGRHGLEAFMAAHHLNCAVDATTRRPWSFESWDDYNRILDEASR